MRPKHTNVLVDPTNFISTAFTCFPRVNIHAATQNVRDYTTAKPDSKASTAHLQLKQELQEYS